MRDCIFLLLMILYQLFLILYIQKINILCSSGFLILYAIFVAVVIITNRLSTNQENQEEEQRRATVFLGAA